MGTVFNHIRAGLAKAKITLTSAGQILSGYKTYDKDGNLVTGTMANNGAVSQTLNPNSSYTIPAGYHNGSGKITANANTGTYTPTSRSASLDMGIANTYRYVNTNSVPNTNSATYSVTSNGTKDMGATNTYRYVSVSVKPIEVGFVILKLANYNHEFYFNLSTGAKANSDAYNTTGISSANMQYRVYQQVFGTDYAQIIAKTAGLYWDNISNTTRQLSAGTTILSIKNTTNNSMSIGIAVKLT
mgnify:CR=1 FL=1